MTIQLPADLQSAITDEARRLSVSPAQLVEQTLRQHFAASACQELTAQQPPLLEPRDDWERRLRAIAIPCGISLSNEDLSSEGLYD